MIIILALLAGLVFGMKIGKKNKKICEIVLDIEV